jgi:hypothetical protein
MNDSLQPDQQQKLMQALQAIFALPFVDDVEDFIWEALFAYLKDIPLVDPLKQIRSKKLFDVIDPNHSIGWSLKAIQ